MTKKQKVITPFWHYFGARKEFCMGGDWQEIGREVSGSSHMWQGSPHVSPSGGQLCALLVVVGPQQQWAGPWCGEKRSRVQGKSRHTDRKRPFGGPENVSGAKFLNAILLEIVGFVRKNPCGSALNLFFPPRAPFQIMDCANFCSDQLQPGLVWEQNKPSHRSIDYFYISAVTMEQEMRLNHSQDHPGQSPCCPKVTLN